MADPWRMQMNAIECKDSIFMKFILHEFSILLFASSLRKLCFHEEKFRDIRVKVLRIV